MVRGVDFLVHVVVGLDEEDLLVDAAGTSFFTSPPRIPGRHSAAARA
jgi:hypothetical protein